MRATATRLGKGTGRLELANYRVGDIADNANFGPVNVTFSMNDARDWLEGFWVDLCFNRSFVGDVFSHAGIVASG